MTLPTGRTKSEPLRAFTLIELIMVMTLLVVVISLAAPSLAGFFRGRALDSEARRLLSLTRQGQSRAASEGVPMILWVDTGERTYGLEADRSYIENDTKAVEYQFDNSVNLKFIPMDNVRSLLSGSVMSGKRPVSSKHSSRPHICFQPDGSIDENSFETVQVLDREGTSLWVALGRSGLNYEIHDQAAERAVARR